MIGRLALPAVTALVLLLAVSISRSPAPADGATRGPSAKASEPVVRVSSASVRIGERLTVSGRGLVARTRVAVRLSGRRVALTRVGRRGRFTVAFRVPAVSTGRRRLTVLGRGVRVSRRISVLPVAASPPAAAPAPAPSQPPPPVLVPPPIATPTPVPAAVPDPIIAAAGDVACDPSASSYNGGSGTSSACRQRATSNQLVDKGLTAVLVLGDLQYEDASYSNFLRSFDRSWGRAKSLLRPVPGNREYETGRASGYFDYFNGRGAVTGQAADRRRGYYSFDLGRWHIVALNSNCDAVGGCGRGSTQYEWLRDDLARSSARCTLAYFHHPRFTSGAAGGSTAVGAFWDLLDDDGADVILSGHAHGYERFAPQTPEGSLDRRRGIRQFVVGTGGNSLEPFLSSQSHTETRNNSTYGVLKMRLGAAGYGWRFEPAAGYSYTDSGSASCH